MSAQRLVSAADVIRLWRADVPDAAASAAGQASATGSAALSQLGADIDAHSPHSPSAVVFNHSCQVVGSGGGDGHIALTAVQNRQALAKIPHGEVRAVDDAQRCVVCATVCCRRGAHGNVGMSQSRTGHLCVSRLAYAPHSAPSNAAHASRCNVVASAGCSRRRCARRCSEFDYRGRRSRHCASRALLGTCAPPRHGSSR